MLNEDTQMKNAATKAETVTRRTKLKRLVGFVRFTEVPRTSKRHLRRFLAQIGRPRNEQEQAAFDKKVQKRRAKNKMATASRKAQR